MTNRLFPIALKGVGTCDVESFPSYIHRSAFEHGLYVGELLRFVYRHGITEISRSTEFSKLPKYIKTGDFLHLNRTTKLLVEVFEVMTQQELKPSTLWFLDHSFGRSSNEIHDSFRWCPECFTELFAQEEQPYFKLIWHMTGISVCPIHKTPLMNRCSSCNCDQKTYVKKYPIGFCQDCGKPLSLRTLPIKPSEIANSWECKGSDILELFSDLAKSHPSEIPKGGVKTSLESLFNHYWKSGREDHFYSLLSRDELLAILFNQKQISLKIARRIAFRLGVSLFVLMSGKAHHSSAVLNSDWVCELPESFSISSKIHKDHKAILKRVKRIIKTSGEPLSLNALAIKARVSSGYLEYRHPALVKTIVSQHQDHIKLVMLRKRKQAQAAALSYFVDEKYGNNLKSRRQAYKELRKQTGLPKHMLLKAIQSAYLALN